MALPIRSALRSAGQYLARNPFTLAKVARHAAGLRVAIPLDALRWFVEHTPPGRLLAGLHRARALARQDSVEFAAHQLGNGSQVTAYDTVPFVIWSAARRLDDYEDAIWRTIEGGGDVDTTCAMVGGIVAAHVGPGGVPPHWLAGREPLPDWLAARPT